MNVECNVDSDLLITLVSRGNAVLWCKTIDDYKDRRLNYAAWKDVCHIIFKYFDTMSEKDKNDAGI